MWKEDKLVCYYLFKTSNNLKNFWLQMIKMVYNFSLNLITQQTLYLSVTEICSFIWRFRNCQDSQIERDEK